MPVVAAQVATPGVATPAPTPPDLNLYEIANNPYLASVLYNTPSRMASHIAPDGAVGVNATWEAGQAPAWYIEEQSYGADFVQAGLVTGDTNLVKQGWAILDWGFAHEAIDGSFPGTGDPFHSTSIFVEAGARALLLEVQSGAPDAAQLVANYLPKVDASALWLMQPKVAAAGAGDDAPYTHRRWLLAAALGEVAELTSDPVMGSAAAAYAMQGLSLQTPDGINPERGGGDTSYQAYGILLAERYLTTTTDEALRGQIEGMIVLGLSWETAHISSTGQVSEVGDTRTGVDLSRSGTIKSINYKTIIQAYALAERITDNPADLGEAMSVATSLGWKTPENINNFKFVVNSMVYRGSRSRGNPEVASHFREISPFGGSRPGIRSPGHPDRENCPRSGGEAPIRAAYFREDRGGQGSMTWPKGAGTAIFILYWKI